MLDSRSDEYSQNVPCHIICVRDTAFYFECAHMWWCHRILTSNHAYTCNYAFIMVFLFSSVIFWDPSEQRRGPRALPGQIYIYSLRMLSFLLSLPPTTPQPLQFFIFYYSLFTYVASAFTCPFSRVGLIMFAWVQQKWKVRKRKGKRKREYENLDGKKKKK